MSAWIAAVRPANAQLRPQLYATFAWRTMCATNGQTHISGQSGRSKLPVLCGPFGRGLTKCRHKKPGLTNCPASLRATSNFDHGSYAIKCVLQANVSPRYRKKFVELGGIQARYASSNDAPSTCPHAVHAWTILGNSEPADIQEQQLRGGWSHAYIGACLLICQPGGCELEWGIAE